MRNRSAVAALLGVGIGAAAAVAFWPGGDPKQDPRPPMFAQLTAIRDHKRETILAHFEAIRERAWSIRSDRQMMRYHREMQGGSEAGSDLEYDIDEYYAEQYGQFYDILFVDASGLVFHSIRKEADYGRCFSEGELSTTRLAQRMRGGDEMAFVEYEYYPPSDEVAAFFSVPLEPSEGGGWIVLQCSINRANAILSERGDLGRTGEVYLVNARKLMLSDSRFAEDSTILRLRVDTRAVREALQGGKGERVIEDYRGVAVLSSYERFEIFGTTWIIIAEIDEAEVLTEHYRQHRDYFVKEIPRYLARSPRGARGVVRKAGACRRVDMGEFGRVRDGESLQTHGVSTCTAVSIALPGCFGYLLHVPPTDETYAANGLLGSLPVGNGTRLVGSLLARIRHFDIRPCQLRELEIAIVAPHERSLCRTVDTIIAQGVELSSVKFLHNPAARGANVTMEAAGAGVQAEWYGAQGTGTQDAAHVESLGEIVSRMIEEGPNSG